MPKQARPCIDQVTIPSEESAVTSKVCSVKRLRRLGYVAVSLFWVEMLSCRVCGVDLSVCCRLQTPRNGIDFDMHSCFLLKELRSLYATHWVAPIVWPYKHDGFLRSCDFHSFSDVFPASPASEFSPYIMIVTVSGDPYSPDVTDVHLPKNFREFAGCARCGREAMDDCWAMGAMMDYDSQAVTGTTHLACVYCATYQAIADFLQPNWWKMLQIEVGNVALMFDSTKSTTAKYTKNLASITCMYATILLWICSSYMFTQLSQLQCFRLSTDASMCFGAGGCLEDEEQWK